MAAMHPLPGTEGNAPRASRAGLVLFLLYLLNLLLVLDKIILQVLIEPIKAEFHLSDFRVGLLTGAVYAVCLGIASLPFGLLVDRYSRRNIAAAALAFWSVMTALCGFARSYPLLLAARLGVGIGEAGGGPASLSIISDLYPHRRRATAMALFSLGTPSSALVNLVFMTKIAHSYGWRAALLAASIPGVLLAIALMLLVREPSRGARNSVRETAPPLGTTLRYILAHRSLVHLLCGAMVAYIVLAGVSSWTFSFLVRVHHVKLAEVGPLLGVSIAGAGIAGLFLAGRLADYLAQRDERWRTWVMAGSSTLAVLFGTTAFTVQNWYLTVACNAALAATCTLWLAPGYALSQSLVPERMRGTIGAIIFMLGNVVGYGLGPSLVGLLSDLLAHAGSSNSLRAALLAAVCCNLWSAVHFLLASKSVRKDLAEAAANQETI